MHRDKDGADSGSDPSDWNQSPDGKSSTIPHRSVGLPVPFREEAPNSAASGRGPLHPDFHGGLIAIFSFIYRLTLGSGTQGLAHAGQVLCP